MAALTTMTAAGAVRAAARGGAPRARRVPAASRSVGGLQARPTSLARASGKVGVSAPAGAPVTSAPAMTAAVAVSPGPRFYSAATPAARRRPRSTPLSETAAELPSDADGVVTSHDEATAPPRPPGTPTPPIKDYPHHPPPRVIHHPSAQHAFTKFTPRWAATPAQGPAPLPIPAYRLVDAHGHFVAGATGAAGEGVGEENILAGLGGRPRIEGLFRTMLRLREMDAVLTSAQRQGRVSFMMSTAGEEAAVIGAAAALRPDDEVLAQYREHGVLLHRGWGLAEFVNQCVGNVKGSCKGRQMPIHYGSVEHHFHTISSTLATQMPQAVGVAYALKLRHRLAAAKAARREDNGGDGGVGSGGSPRGNGGKSAPPAAVTTAVPTIAACFFGDGASSEGDAHAAFNFAPVLGSPTLFLCRNNGYAISTPASEQYAGDGIAGRGPGYGMPAARIDGSDLLAVLSGIAAARAAVATTCRPFLVELLAYRQNAHSTSDDASRYRRDGERDAYIERADPVARLRALLHRRGWWMGASEEGVWRAAVRAEVVAALAAAEALPRPGWEDLFEDVYDAVPPGLVRQRDELGAHIARAVARAGGGSSAGGGP